MLVFVFELNADNGSSVFKIQPFKLVCNLVIKAVYIKKVAGIVGTDLERTAVQPVGQTSVAHFAMAKRADPYDHLHIVFLTEFHKFPQVQVPLPVEFAFLIFMQDPEYIAGDDIDSPGFHLLYFLIPVLVRVTAIMKFSHHGKKGFPVALDIKTVYFDGFTRDTYSSQVEVSPYDFLLSPADVDGIVLLSGSRVNKTE